MQFPVMFRKKRINFDVYTVDLVNFSSKKSSVIKYCYLVIEVTIKNINSGMAHLRFLKVDNDRVS